MRESGNKAGVHRQAGCQQCWQFQFPPNAEGWLKISDFPNATFLLSVGSACVAQALLTTTFVVGVAHLPLTLMIAFVVAHVTGIAMTVGVAVGGPSLQPHTPFDLMSLAWTVACMILWGSPYIMGSRYIPYQSRFLFSLVHGCWLWFGTLCGLCGFHHKQNPEHITSFAPILRQAAVRTWRVIDGCTDVAFARLLLDTVRFDRSVFC
jgi:hypothetical protein